MWFKIQTLALPDEVRGLQQNDFFNQRQANAVSNIGSTLHLQAFHGRFKGHENVVIYGGYIVVYSFNEVEHLNRIQKASQPTKKSGQRINRPKSQVARTQIGQGANEPLPEKMSTIQQFQIPNWRQNLRLLNDRVWFYCHSITVCNKSEGQRHESARPLEWRSLSISQ